MVEAQESLRWNKQNLRSLRLRLGWSRSELAHRLHCSLSDIEAWEENGQKIDSGHISELEILLRQAEECSEEIHYTPAAESQCELKALEQIHFSQVKADFE